MRSSCSVGVKPSTLGVSMPATHLAAQAGHPHHVELVEVGGRDRQEAQPLEQRMALVLGFLQHSAVEMEPGQFAVEKAAGSEGGNARARLKLRSTFSGKLIDNLL